MPRTPAASDTPLAILLVEDVPLVRMVAADALVDAAYRVIEAGDADEALVLLDARPDIRVMVTDVRMPGQLDGIELAHVVAKRRPEVGIVVVSGDTFPAQGDLPSGAVFVPKPYFPSQLVLTVAVLTAQNLPEQPISIEAAIVVPDDAGATDALSPSREGEEVTRQKDAET